jgi:hypothetical protein
MSDILEPNSHAIFYSALLQVIKRTRQLSAARPYTFRVGNQLLVITHRATPAAGNTRLAAAWGMDRSMTRCIEVGR